MDVIIKPYDFLNPDHRIVKIFRINGFEKNVTFKIVHSILENKTTKELEVKTSLQFLLNELISFAMMHNDSSSSTLPIFVKVNVDDASPIKKYYVTISNTRSDTAIFYTKSDTSRVYEFLLIQIFRLKSIRIRVWSLNEYLNQTIWKMWNSMNLYFIDWEQKMFCSKECPEELIDSIFEFDFSK